MRCLELILTLACAGYCIRLANFPKVGTLWLVVLPLLLVALFIAQILLEGWRWQMLPVYAVVLAAVADSLAPGARSATTMLYAAVAALAVLALSTVASLVFQHLALTRPGGTLPVGFTTLPYSPRQPGRSNGSEQLPAPLKQVWYPAAPFALGRRVAASLHTVREPPEGHRHGPGDSGPAAGKRSREVSAAGLCGRLAARQRAESLAHLRSGEPGLYGRVAAVPRQTPRDDSAGIRRAACPPRTAHGGLLFRCGLSTDGRIGQRAHRIFAGDAAAVLDEIASLDHGEGIAGIGRMVDPQRAGVFGFSFGGGVAAQASRADPRFKAAVNIDGRHWADGLQHGVEQPYMFLGERLLMPTAEQLASSDPATRYEAGITHRLHSTGE